MCNPVHQINFHLNQLPVRFLEEAVNAFSKLPGVGRKTALRFALFLLRQSEEEAARFGNALFQLRKNIRYCRVCHNLSETPTCSICSDARRDGSLICVVEDIRDVIAIESTAQFKGLYHVLGGIISPMDGIGPSQLSIESLVDRVQSGEINEVVMALSSTMEGDTTMFFIYKKLKPFNLKITAIARGIAIGGELEYADEITLGRSILNRTDYENMFSIK